MLGMAAGMEMTAPPCATRPGRRKPRPAANANNAAPELSGDLSKAVHSDNGYFPVRADCPEWRDLFRALRLLQSDREAIRFEEWAETHREFCDRLTAIERRINIIGGALVGDAPASPEWAGALSIAAGRLEGEGATPRIAFPYFSIPLGSRPWTEEGDTCPHRRIGEAEYFLLSPDERKHAIFYGEDPAAYFRRRRAMRENFDGGYAVVTASREDVYDCWPLLNRPDRRAVHSPVAGAGRFAFPDTPSPSIEEETRVRYSREWGRTRLTVLIESDDIRGGALQRCASVAIEEAATEFTDNAAAEGYSLPPEKDEADNAE